MTVELETSDPRVARGLHTLTVRLSYFVGMDLDSNNIERMEGIVRDFRASFKAMHGYEFPYIVPFVLPSVKLILFYRADLEDQVIHDKMLSLLRQMAAKKMTVSAIELASAIRRCWPRYEPPIESLRKNPHGSQVGLQ